MQRFFGVSQDASGNAIPSVTVTVNLASTGTAATLYSDNAFTPLANPLTSNTDGTYQFYAHNGRYDVVLTKTSFTFTASETTDVLLDDEFSVVSPAQITSTQNNYAPTNGTDVSIWRINSDATRSITGIAAPLANAGQRILTLINTGSFNINLVNASASSTAGNKFTCANGRDYALFTNEQVQLVYDTASAVWRVPWQGARTIDNVSAGTAISNSAAETTVYSKTLSGGLLGTTGSLRLVVAAKMTNTTGGGVTSTLRLKYGGTTIANTGALTQIPTGSTAVSVNYCCDIANTGATNTQDGTAYSMAEQPGLVSQVAVARGTAAIDSTVDQTLLISMQLTVGAPSVNFTYQRTWARLEWLP